MNPYTPEGQVEILQKLQNHDVSAIEIITLIFLLTIVPHQLVLFLSPFIQNAGFFIQNYYLPTILVFILFILTYIALRLHIYKKSLYEEKVIFQIIPPDSVTQSPLATEEFFAALHDIGSYTKSYFKFFSVKKTFSLELVSTKEEGIRYFLSVPNEDVKIVKKTILSYLPDAKIKEKRDYLSKSINGWVNVSDIIMSNDPLIPLSEKKILSEHDPIGFLTGQMTKLSYDEMIVLQFVISPVNSKTHKKLVKRVQHIAQAIHNNCYITPYLNQKFLPRLAWLPFRVIRFLLLFSIGLIFWQINLLLFLITFGGIKMLIIEIFRHKDEPASLSGGEKQLYEDINKKVKQNLFESTIRIFITSKTKDENTLRQRGIMSSLTTFNYPNYQSYFYKPQTWFSRYEFIYKFDIFKLRHRLLSFTQNPILSTSELSNIYHFPFTQTTKTEGIIKTKLKTLPPPISFKKRTPNFDMTFGSNSHNGEDTIVGLTNEERKRHMYIIGATGTGKTTLLSSMIYQDIQSSKGLCVIDPHGDLTQTILGTIPKKRINDVVFFNPMDRAFPIGLNLLELRKDLTEEQLQDEKDIITSSIISVFQKLYTAKYFGPRMEHILRYAILTALDTDNPTLFTIQKILTDKQYRNKLVPRISDPVVKDFWLHEFKRLGSYQQAEITAPITNKLGRFLASPLCRNILGQKISTIDFDKILNDGKILLCSLPKGSIGEDNSAFFGVLVTAKIQLAALHRVSIPEKNRREFYIYVDEFQNFATPSFAQILSEARKYGLSAILAHQTIAQLEDNNLTKVILANTGTNICFRTSSPLDEDYILPIFEPEVKKGEIGNLPSFSYYCKINALKPYDTFSGETEPFNITTNAKIAQAIILSSQQSYGVARKLVEEDINQFYLNKPQIENNHEIHTTKKPVNKEAVGSAME